MRSTLAGLLVLAALGAGCGESSAPAKGVPHLLSLRKAKPALILGRPMMIKCSITNASGSPCEVPIPADYLEGFVVKGPDGKEVRKRREGVIRERVRVEARKSVDREIDVAPLIELAGNAEGRYTLRWSFAAARSNELEVVVVPDAVAVIETALGNMTIEFFPEEAPGHVVNFVKLARKGFYDGLQFHRIISGFMIQGGCPKGDGTEGPGYTLRAEFNEKPHVFGTVSMARMRDPDSAGSQFFLCLDDLPEMNGKYSVFGRLVEGEEVLRRIGAVKTDHDPCKGCGARLPEGVSKHCGTPGHHDDRPLDPVIMKKVTIRERSRNP